jgi:hypothetical protein
MGEVSKCELFETRFSGGKNKGEMLEKMMVGRLPLSR